MPRAFVTGWPIRHSRSPLIHRFWLSQLAIDGSYDAMAIPPDEFPSFLSGLGDNGFVGGNVTIPHKEAAFAGVARRDGDAEVIGAVNTIWLENGSLVGGNTDAYGFTANLDERLAGWRDAQTAVVLGAGGAARAVVHALLASGIRSVRILNRTPQRAEALAAAFGARAKGYGLDDMARHLVASELLVNTAPSSAYAEPPDLSALPDHALVTDIVYVPLITPVLQAAIDRNLRTADGIGMLLHQAVPGFERWFGSRPAVSPDLRQRVLDDIAQHG
ncbi:shikimate dehydrogenase [Consotaella aegiceratis]|uniref:shikimate dehydrogenase n=1 Tax=Consotaella aegiceratis TaxID=3097961 RepID=UPI003D800C8E